MRHAILLAGLGVAACAGPELQPRVEQPPPALGAASASAAAVPSSAPASAPPPTDAGVTAPDPCEAKIASTHSAFNAPVALEGRTVAPAQIKAALVAHHKWSPSEGKLHLCTYRVYGHDPGHVYVWSLCEGVDVEGGRVVMKSAVSMPSVIDLDSAGAISGIRSPRDGSSFGPDMKVLFPEHIRPNMKYSHPEFEQALHAEAACRLGAPAP